MADLRGELKACVGLLSRLGARAGGPEGNAGQGGMGKWLGGHAQAEVRGMD